MKETNNTSDFNKLVQFAKKLVNGNKLSDLEFTQINDTTCHTLQSLDISQDELWEKYGSILNLQDDLDYAGIPVKEKVRKLWDQNALKKQQLDLVRIVGSCRKDIIEECKTLINKFSI